MDENKDGVIRYREFKKIMNKNRIVSWFNIFISFKYLAMQEISKNRFIFKK